MGKNIIEGMEWGKDIFQYIQVNHLLGQETGKSSFLCINAPEGIGKKELIQKICNLIGREFSECGYNEWLCINNFLPKLYNRKNLLVYIYDTPIENGYCNEINNFIDKYSDNEKISNIIFVFSSSANLGINIAINSKFHVFLYGRLSIAEKIAYARTIVKKWQKYCDLENVYISDEILKYIILFYTKEVGISNLSSLISDLFKNIYWNDKTNDDRSRCNKEITYVQVHDILGNEKYVLDQKIIQNHLPVVGMAWTKWGGMLLPIEMLVMKGSGQIHYSGNMGKLMKESAEVVFSYFKVNYKKWKIRSNFFLKHDIHINIYEQGIYKDGSSAGLAFFVKFLCVLKNIKVEQTTAFAGEVSLEGRVIRVGGLKEKLCIAQEYGIKRIILPAQSWNEFQLLPNDLKENLNVGFIDDVNELEEII